MRRTSSRRGGGIQENTLIVYFIQEKSLNFS